MKQRLNFSPAPFTSGRSPIAGLWLLNVLLVAALAFVLFYWSNLRQQNRTAHDQIDQLRGQQQQIVDQHQDRIRELERIDVRAYRKQVGQFYRIQTAWQTDWGALLDDLGEILPPDVRIVSLEPSATISRNRNQDRNDVINLKAESRNKEAQLTFIRALQEHKDFQDIRFEIEEYDRSDVAVAFEIRFSHKPVRGGGS